MYTHTTHVPVPHRVAWKAQKAFPVDAKVQLLVNVTRWRPGGTGADFFAKVLGPLTADGATPTVADCIALGKKLGFSTWTVQAHLRWLYTWGDQVAIGGQKYQATVEAKAPKKANVPAKVA